MEERIAKLESAFRLHNSLLERIAKHVAHQTATDAAVREEWLSELEAAREFLGFRS